ncbi:MAG TPA: DUF6599 family protein [Terriglobales bacterium]|nr:DUF6599 family protein [Terriglobales bacterium]
MPDLPAIMLRPFFMFVLLAAPAGAVAQIAPLLPDSFAGWQKQAPSQKSTQAQIADPTQPALLAEFGFTDFESARYVRGDRSFDVRAARFRDSSGAYGAFTFYRPPEMQEEQLGDMGGSVDRHVLFYRGNILVTAVLDRLTAMSAAELRALADALPQGTSREGTQAPSLPAYLPHTGAVRNSGRYILGPAGLATSGLPLPAESLDFSSNPEIALARYQTTGGEAMLAVISYPTPQIAAARLKTLEAFGASRPDLRLNTRRSGPLVAVVSGVTPGDAQPLLAAVNYDADITWNENTFLSPRDNIGNLLLAIFVLIGFILLFALVAGVAFGGVRIFVKRLFPGRVFDRPQEMEIIRLNLGEQPKPLAGSGLDDVDRRRVTDFVTSSENRPTS